MGLLLQRTPNSSKRWVLFKEQFKKRTLTNGPDEKEGNNGNDHVGKSNGANFSIVCTSDWLKQQKFRKRHKAVHIFILIFQPFST